ncbi:hypothetical protein ACFQZC_00605 [Streptacidiphilus monticola]
MNYPSILCSCPPPERNLCQRCAGFGLDPGKPNPGPGREPLCPDCRGDGGMPPHDFECQARIMFDPPPA